MSTSAADTSPATQTAQSAPKISLAFAVLLLLATLGFIYWGYGYTEQNHVILFTLSTLFGVFMAFNIGGNDVANSFGTGRPSGRLARRN